MRAANRLGASFGFAMAAAFASLAVTFSAGAQPAKADETPLVQTPPFASDTPLSFTDRLAIRPPPLPNKPESPPGETALPGIDYDTPRYEPAGFPIIAGSSDIGFQAGGVGTLTRFGGGVRPYVWNMDLVLTASAKTSPTNGIEVV